MVGMAVGADRQVAGAGAAAAAVQLQAEHGMGVEAEAEAARRVAGGELEAQALGGFLAVAVALAPGLEAVAPGVVRAVAVVAVEVVGAGEELQFAVLDEAPIPGRRGRPSESVPATRPANTARLRFCIYCFLPPECQVGAVSEVAPQAACVSCLGFCRGLPLAGAGMCNGRPGQAFRKSPTESVASAVIRNGRGWEPRLPMQPRLREYAS